MTREPSYRAQYRQWCREQRDAPREPGEGISASTIADAALAHFLQNAAFMRAFAAEVMRPMFYELTLEVFGETRRQRNGPILVVDSLLDPAAFEAAAERLSAKWGGWLEHANGRHIRLEDMRRVDILSAIAEREQRVARERSVITFLQRIAARLEGEQTVGEVFTAEEIKEIRRALALAPSELSPMAAD